MLAWMNHKVESRLQGEISTTSDDITLMAEEKEIKNLLMRMNEESEYQNTLSASWEICMQAKNQRLELDMEQQTGSK